VRWGSTPAGRVRVLVINPVGHPRWDEVDKAIYESFASPNTEIVVKSFPEGPPSVEDPEAHAWVEHLVVKYGLAWFRQAEAEGRPYDAIIPNCFLDPGAENLKALVPVPVVGPCEASLALARVLGSRRVAVVTVGNKALWMIEERIRKAGYGDLVEGVYGIGLGVLDLDKDREATVREVVGKAREALRDGADTIILGCTGLAGLAKEVEEVIKAPVIDPAGAAIKVAEGLVKVVRFTPARY